MITPVSPLFVTLFVVQLIVLSFWVIKHRVKHEVAVGDGGHDYLKRTIAAHNNFSQFTPFLLIILFFFEMSGASDWATVLLGLVMLAGRISHSYGILVAEVKPTSNMRPRQIGMLATFASLTIGALGIVINHYF